VGLGERKKSETVWKRKVGVRCTVHFSRKKKKRGEFMLNKSPEQGEGGEKKKD